MKRPIFAATMYAVAGLAAAGCSSLPLAAPASTGFTEESLSGGRLRIAYEAPAAEVSRQKAADRTLARAAQLTLDRGNEWFEIQSNIEGRTDGRNTQTLVIVMGSGEALAGGPKQYNAKETLASLRPNIG